MALNPKYSTTCVNAKANAVGDALNSGYLRVYDGSQPTDANTAIGAQNLLAELRFDADAFGAAVAGVITANAIVQDSSANLTGTATWARVFASNGTTVWFDGTAGTGTVNFVLNTASIVSGAVVSCSSFTLTENAG
jgi:hypothetical protein